MDIGRDKHCATMAEGRVREEIITKFFQNTCQIRRRRPSNDNDERSLFVCAAVAATGAEFISSITGSNVEFYIEPMLPCVGDVDIMWRCSYELAIPAGCSPPTQLPGEFDSRVDVYEIVDSEFPGYVYLVKSYILTECVNDGKYNAVQRERLIATRLFSHGPAFVNEHNVVTVPMHVNLRLADSRQHIDIVYCMRCLMWPPTAANWPARQRTYGWPGSATVGSVVSDGCDLVCAAHHLCRQDELMSKRQFRMSFSRAEIVLLNSWMPVQQIVYHMLRTFVKTKQLTDNADDTGPGTVSNYHIKTLMLWACELKSRSWWTDDLNLVRICVELLHTLAVWLTDARCQHYFINNCNLFDRFEYSHCTQATANRLLSITRAWFCEWCIDSYVYKCAQLCPSSVSSMLWDPSSRRSQDGLHDVTCLHNTVSSIVECRQYLSQILSSLHFTVKAQCWIMELVSSLSLTLQSCICWNDQLANTDQVLQLYFTAVVFLHVAHKTTRGSLTDEMMDVLATTCLQLTDARRCLNARHSSALSLSQAAMLMKVVVNSSCSTVQLIEMELSKAYLHRALTCKDCDSCSIYCLANVYLAVLYYTTGQYQAAMDNCALVTSLQDHCKCSSHVVEGELLPHIDDHVDSSLGLAVFYEYIRADALNKEQEKRHVSVFTTELFAHYLHIKFLSVAECCQIPQTSLIDEIWRYQKCFCNSLEIYATDMVLFGFAKCTKYPSDGRLVTAYGDESRSFDTSKLVELLQQSAVEHLTTYREFEAQERHTFGHVVVTADFKALYAYKCGRYQHCLQLSMSMLTSFAGRDMIPGCGIVIMCPELIQLMDDDIVSVLGLMMLVNQSHESDRGLFPVVSQLSLSLYLMAECQIKLCHTVTSLATTLECIQAQLTLFEIRQIDIEQIVNAVSRLEQVPAHIADLPVLKFVEQKILRYISPDH